MQLGTHTHYKGKQYEILGVAHHTETNEKMVVYRALYDCPDLTEEYGTRPLFVRPYTEFTELVEVAGKNVFRFTYAGESTVT